MALLEQLQQRLRSVSARGAAPTLDLLLSPQELRTADPSLAADLASGTFGLAGDLLSFTDRSPFDLNPPSERFRTELHGFAWLSDLRAAGSPEAHAIASRLVLEWIDRFGMGGDAAWHPRVTARRFISWLTSASFLIQRATPEFYERLVTSLSRHQRSLLTSRGGDADGIERIEVGIAAVFGCLCLTEQENELPGALDRLLKELHRQILPDGSHISRHPGVLVELLLDLLPLKTCFTARDQKVPAELIDVTRRMIQMVRHMRLGDGGLARFHGMGPDQPDRTAAVLSYDDWQAPQIDTSSASRYLRMQRRQSIVLFDGGPPPPPQFSGEAHAGCLSFEMSAGHHLLIVNCGAPGPADQDWRLPARSTSSHSTLVLNDQSSSRMVRVDGSGRALAVPQLVGPSQVEAKASAGDDGAAEIRGQHRGYLEPYGLMHQRALRLTAQGDRLDGVDRIYRASKISRPKQSLGFTVHFHVGPRAEVRLDGETKQAMITLPDGQRWQLAAQNVMLGLEESVFLARFSGPTLGVQVVLRGQTMDDTEVRWRLQRVWTD